MPQLLNSPIEFGLRALVLLTTAFPERLDLARLVMLDHCLVHSADLGGPASPFPALPGRSGQMGMRRSSMEAGVRLMLRAGLVEAHATDQGIEYGATEGGEPFLDVLEAEHVSRLKVVAEWVIEMFRELDDERLRDQMGELLGRWNEEFSLLPADGEGMT
jgi:hypothetical protein